jgi:hypothetical protein
LLANSTNNKYNKTTNLRGDPYKFVVDVRKWHSQVLHTALQATGIVLSL